MSLRDSLYILGIMALIFVANLTGHWEQFGYMVMGACMMLLYLKGGSS